MLKGSYQRILRATRQRRLGMKERNERQDHSVQDEREAATPQQLLVFYENKGPFLLDWQELSLTHKVLLAQQILELL